MNGRRLPATISIREPVCIFPGSQVRRNQPEESVVALEASASHPMYMPTSATGAVLGYAQRTTLTHSMGIPVSASTTVPSTLATEVPLVFF
jgi:hypothetical protein